MTPSTLCELRDRSNYYAEQILDWPRHSPQSEEKLLAWYRLEREKGALLNYILASELGGAL